MDFRQKFQQFQSSFERNREKSWEKEKSDFCCRERSNQEVKPRGAAAGRESQQERKKKTPAAATAEAEARSRAGREQICSRENDRGWGAVDCELQQLDSQGQGRRCSSPCWMWEVRAAAEPDEQNANWSRTEPRSTAASWIATNLVGQEEKGKNHYPSCLPSPQASFLDLS